MKYFIGTLVIGVGFLLMWKSEWLINNVGRIGWAEQHLGTEGGSRLFYKLIGLLLIVGTFLFWTGAGLGLLRSIFSGTTPT
jgi:hypothetical protein